MNGREKHQLYNNDFYQWLALLDIMQGVAQVEKPELVKFLSAEVSCGFKVLRPYLVTLGEILIVEDSTSTILRCRTTC